MRTARSAAVVTTVLAVVALAGCADDGGTGSTSPSSRPTTSTAEPSTTSPSSTTSSPPDAGSPELPQGLVVGATCEPLDPGLLTAIDDSFREPGQHLDHAQMVGAADGTVYAGGDVVAADGSPVAPAALWVFPVAGYALFSASDDAVSLSEWPDGREALGLDADDDTVSTLVGCVTDAP